MSVFDYVTERIVKQLESGVIPWKRPWSLQGLPKNLISKKEYNGVNIFLLNTGHVNPFFLTAKQAAACDCKLKSGAIRYMVIFWKRFEHESKEPDAKPTYSYMLRYYYVYHYSDVIDADQPKLTKHLDKVLIKRDITFNPIEQAESISNGMPSRPEIESNSKACYMPREDKVGMPESMAFITPEHYYHTLFHELSHATGHKARLDRFKKEHDHNFGSQDYSQEELVAEFSAAFLSAHAGITEQSVEDNETAYIASWLKAFKNDAKMLVFAAAQAQKATNYILGVKPIDYSETQGEV